MPDTEHTEQKLAAEEAGATNTRRGSFFDRFRSKSHIQSPDNEDTAKSEQDTSSLFSTNTTHSRYPLLGRKSSTTPDQADKKPKKEKRESMASRGAFRIEYTASGLPIAIENKDWPPGVSYKTSSQMKQLKNADGSGGLGAFYEKSGSIAPGGENAGNIGPDPDWVPGLAEAEREKLKKDTSGKYVF
ncbi:hypothetical protein H2198_005969 [Neophaeococcomyces mojaviensis]|uniref:Uncharacterized protein n=1 Tax=Neophaeococcomyces mojaviensis TaxID=3383035 RepID=A0ACC3A4S5_9EURO|nr:hypothetical protein H2198_005969 [Knufia sp. JES_112]